jgi:predicted protein tyrosine phosphatase
MLFTRGQTRLEMGQLYTKAVPPLVDMYRHNDTSSPPKPDPLVRMYRYDDRTRMSNYLGTACALAALPRLYVGGYKWNVAFLCEHDISVVISLDDHNPPDAHLIQYPYERHVIRINDVPDAPIEQHFAATTEWIDHALSQGKGVLVHCAAGVSRSVTIVCAYLIKKQGCSTNEALTRVRQVRSFADPNVGFMQKLKVLETG